MPPVDLSQQPQPSQDDGTTFDTFSGLKNTVAPERLSARQLARADNVDIDDQGQIHRRRGRNLRIPGRWHSVHRAANGMLFGVLDNVLTAVRSDWSTVSLLDRISDLPLSWEQVADTLYFTSPTNSAQVDQTSLEVKPWGNVTDHAYQPTLQPGQKPFWFSPVVNPDPNPETALGPVAGKLLGPPPLGQALCAFNGRLYIAQGPILWATELYGYNFVNRTRGFRQFEDDITGLIAVEDGVYVGTTAALYFLAGSWEDHRRTMREPAGVLPRSMVLAPGGLVDPEGRRFPDLPRQTSRAMMCMTTEGVVVGLGGGSTFNVTRTDFIYPPSRSAAALFRHEDGIASYVTACEPGADVGGTARFGDYCDAVLIRTPPTPGQPNDVVPPNAADPNQPPLDVPLFDQ